MQHSRSIRIQLENFPLAKEGYHHYYLPTYQPRAKLVKKEAINIHS